MNFLKTCLALVAGPGLILAVQAANNEWVNPDLVIPEKQNEIPVQVSPAEPTRMVTGELGLFVTRICDYRLSYSDTGSGGDLDGAFYLPSPPQGFYLIGGFAQGNYSPPTDCILAVAPDTNPQSQQLLRPPRDWELLWTDKKSGARMDGSIWHPIPPDNNYVCIGSIAKEGYGKPQLSNYACLHSCLISNLPAANYIWSDRGTGASQKISIFKLHNSNTFYAIPGHNPPGMLRDIKADAKCNL